VNYGGHFDRDIERINAQFFECDNASLEEQYEKIKAFPLEPSIIIKTRKSLHTYFLIENGNVKDFRKIQRGLIEYFDADKACVNESRLLRLPGFNHCKQKAIKVECVKFNPDIRYTQNELLNVLKTNSDRIMSSIDHKQVGIDYVLNNCEFIRYCKENAKTLSEHDWYAMITNLAVFEGAKQVIHKFSKDYPCYDFDETEQKIRHFMQSKTKPITCKTIAEKGFVCPKLNDCNVKSPAGLCYKEYNTLPKWYEKTKTGVKFIPGILADYLTENIHAYYTAGNFYLYKNGVYKLMEDIEACSIIKSYMFPNKRTMVSINDTLGQWKIGAYKSVQEMSSNTYILNVKNGLYDILSGELKKHTPSYFSNIQLKAKATPHNSQKRMLK
ncbi:MAG: DNA primase, partial [Oscillospiraceae bacterium]|nr:DNA primase [Oscillospiraceae bacterium]